MTTSSQSLNHRQSPSQERLCDIAGPPSQWRTVCTTSQQRGDHIEEFCRRPRNIRSIKEDLAQCEFGHVSGLCATSSLMNDLPRDLLHLKNIINRSVGKVCTFGKYQPKFCLACCIAQYSLMQWQHWPSNGPGPRASGGSLLMRSPCAPGGQWQLVWVCRSIS